MPRSKPCLGNGTPCPARALTKDSTGRCDTCRARRDKDRGSREERGYDHRHRELRKQYEPLVRSGHATCWRCHKPITAEADWDLGHSDQTRPDGSRAHIGPEHTACNRATSGRNANN